MWHNTFLLCLSLTFFSCSLPKVQYKDNSSLGKNTDKLSIKKVAFKKVDNWADEYYEKTYFVVRNPVVLESYDEIMDICKSRDMEFKSDYQAQQAFTILYKDTPINIKTMGGFMKSIYISKGACREFSLFKSQKLNPAKQIRRKIIKMTLIYIYNKGTYLKETLFATPFSDVDFLVE